MTQGGESLAPRFLEAQGDVSDEWVAECCNQVVFPVILIPGH